MAKEVKITKLDHFGRGIYFGDNKINFVFNALPDEHVIVENIKENSKYNEAKVKKYLITSPKRVEPFCPYYGICGGCHLQHMTYENTLDFKKQKVAEIFQKFNLPNSNIEIIANPNIYNYRNKIEIKIRDKKVGFYKLNSHKIVEINECKVAKNSLNELLLSISKLEINNADITLRTNLNDEILIWIKTKEDIIVTREYFDRNIKIASIILNDKVIFGEKHLIFNFDKYLFKCSYDAFFQINFDVCLKIYEYLKSQVKENDIVADLYCGVGFLGILASDKAEKTYGIEIVDNAISDAITNSKINKIDNMYFMLGDVAQSFSKIKEQISFLIVDPPRKGLDKETIDTIIQNKIPKIFYMSCDPVTLARDLKILKDYYDIKEVKIFDMFSWTYHCESVVILERKNSKEN
ncbi:MAG: class I SAM-dependent RNA methyltransferase [Bacilli bacterium]|nr:class I SAM-dependent RNA methyltransferase [Bacilli bacterium]